MKDGATAVPVIDGNYRASPLRSVSTELVVLGVVGASVAFGLPSVSPWSALSLPLLSASGRLRYSMVATAAAPAAPIVANTPRFVTVISFSMWSRASVSSRASGLQLSTGLIYHLSLGTSKLIFYNI